MASPPCVAPVCDPEKAGGPALCASKADWILEGEVNTVADEYGAFCTTGMGCPLWRGASQ
jgi:hypothetical protein